MKRLELSLFTVLLLLCMLYPMAVSAQFHAGVDFRYSMGVSETIVGDDASTAEPTNSIVIAVSGLYEFTPQLWAGIGVSTGINNTSIMEIGTTVKQQPIVQFAPYLTARYHPIPKHLNAYVFTDLGYAIPFSTANNFSEGWMWNAGVGYRYMFHKHFGLNFNVSYNLQQIKGTPFQVSGTAMGVVAENNVRHSIGIAVGVIF